MIDWLPFVFQAPTPLWNVWFIDLINWLTPGWKVRLIGLIDGLIDACVQFEWLILLCCSLWPVWQGLLHPDRTAETSGGPHGGERPYHDWLIDWLTYVKSLIDWFYCVLQPVTCVTKASTPGQDCGNIGWSTPGRDLTGIDPLNISQFPVLLFHFSLPMFLPYQLYTFGF
jgi:hypothetical protein